MKTANFQNNLLARRQIALLEVDQRIAKLSVLTNPTKEEKANLTSALKEKDRLEKLISNPPTSNTKKVAAGRNRPRSTSGNTRGVF